MKWNSLGKKTTKAKIFLKPKIHLEKLIEKTFEKFRQIEASQMKTKIQFDEIFFSVVWTDKSTNLNWQVVLLSTQGFDIIIISL